ncbi:MAG: TonB family protein [Vicinamibacterales bacterium]
MSSPRHASPASGAPPRPDVLSEATDLETLFEAILGNKPPSAPPTAEIDQPDEPPRRDEYIERAPQPAPYVPPRPLDYRPSALSAFASETHTVSQPPLGVEVRREPLLSRAPIGPIAIGTHAHDEPGIGVDHPTTDTTVRRLRVFRTSPWPVMVIVGGMALATVSAIGLRSGSSTTKVEPPLVASPIVALPSGYIAQLPAAPLTALDQQLDPPSTAFGGSRWRPAARAATGSPSATATTPAPTPLPPAMGPAAAVRSAASTPSPPPPAASAAAVSEPPGAASAPAARTEKPVEMILFESARSSPEPRAETPAPVSAPPAVSSTRPTTPGVVVTEAVPELPKPAASRTVVSVVAARRLTGGMPEYSTALRQRRVRGVVDVLLRIDVNGRVISAKALSGPSPLRQAAEAAVLTWQYLPATRNGAPIETESKVSFSFDPSQSRRP